MKNQTNTWVNRRQRRSYLKHVGVLEAKRNLRLSDWVNICNRNQNEGLKRHGEYEDIVRNSIENQLSQIEQRIRLSCSELGFNKEQTDSKVNQWMESLKPWPNF